MTLSVTTVCGTVTTTSTVGIVTPPSASFTASTNSGCGALTVNFTSTSSANSTSFLWSFPGGSPATSTEQNPTVTYSTSGTYTATLTVTNAAGSSTTSQTITVLAAPTAGFSSSMSGLTATFTNNSTGATSYSWDFGDGSNSTEQSPVHTYAAPGDYTVVLTATGPCGTATFTQTIGTNAAVAANFTVVPNSGCAALTVQFTNLSSNATSYLWDFPGGSPAASTEANPVVTYSTSGVYTATLTATNNLGSATFSQTITVNAAPTAAFTSSTAGLTTTFTNTSNGASGYLWDFGDGQSSTEASPVHTYSVPGSYTVVLTTTNACGTATATQTVATNAAVSANFSATPTTGCGPLTVVFTNLSSNATSYLWEFPGGSPATSTEANPTVTYSNSGTYTATLTATNNLGSAAFSQTITVNAPVAAGFTSTANGLLVNFANSSSGAATFLWEFGDGQTSTEQSPSHTYAAPGSYAVTLTASGPCGTAVSTQTVVPTAAPTADFSASPTTGCGPMTVNFTNNSVNATSFSWEFPGGNPATSTAASPTVTYSNSGTYTATLTATNPIGSSTATQTITVLAAPNANFSSSTNGLTATFTNLSNNTGPVQTDWAFGDGSFSTDLNPVHTYAADGSYVVSLTVTNNCGAFTFEQTVVVATPPTAAFSASPTTGCAPLTVQFTNQSSANATSFLWEFPGGTPATSTAASPAVLYSMAGAYSVTLTATNAAGSATAVQTNLVVVNTVPTANFTFSATGGTVVFTSTVSGATSLGWKFGDGATSNEKDPTHTYATSGVYQVVLQATNDCGTTTVTKEINVVIVATGEAAANEFAVFPNPTDGRFFIKTAGNPFKIAQIRVADALGRVVLFEKNPAGQEFSIPDEAAAGSYFLDITTGDGQTLHRKLAVVR